MLPTQADVDALLAHGGTIREPFRWEKRGRSNYKADVWVEDMYEGARVKLSGTYNARTRNLSYSLVWHRRVRGWDIGGPPHGGIPTPHRHLWVGAEVDMPPEPLTVNSDSLEGILREFLAECNIKLEGDFIAAEHQGILL